MSIHPTRYQSLYCKCAKYRRNYARAISPTDTHSRAQHSTPRPHPTSLACGQQSTLFYPIPSHPTQPACTDSSTRRSRAETAPCPLVCCWNLSSHHPLPSPLRFASLQHRHSRSHSHFHFCPPTHSYQHQHSPANPPPPRAASTAHTRPQLCPRAARSPASGRARWRRWRGGCCRGWCGADRCLCGGVRCWCGGSRRGRRRKGEGARGAVGRGLSGRSRGGGAAGEEGAAWERRVWWSQWR